MWDVLLLFGLIFLAGAIVVAAVRWAERDVPPRSRDDWWSDHGDDE